MNGEKLQHLAQARVQELPGVDLEHPFGPEWDVYKVRGKVFMLMTEVTGQPIVINLPRANRPVDPSLFGSAAR